MAQTTTIGTSAFQEAWKRTMTFETNSKSTSYKWDKKRGGNTKYGITQKTATKNGYPDVMLITEEQAKKIGYDSYWKPMELDSVANVDPDASKVLFDVAFWMGPGHAQVVQEV